MGLSIVAVVAGLTGFSTGLLAFRVKNRWCPACGATTLALTEHPSTASTPQASSGTTEVTVDPSTPKLEPTCR